MPRALLWLAFLLCFALAQPKPYLQEQEGDASCFGTRVLDANTNQAIPLPLEVTEYLRCGQVTLSPDGHWLTFEKFDQLMAWDFRTQRTLFLAHISLPVDGIHLTWAPDSQRFALILVQQPSPVPAHLEIRIYRMAPQGVVSEQRFYSPVLFDCASTCFPRSVHWKGPLEFVFQTSLPTLPDNQSHDIPEFDSLFLNRTDPRYSFPPTEDLRANLPLSPTRNISLSVLPSKQLEVQGPNLVQRFPLPSVTLNPDVAPIYRTTVRLDDFNFDGWLDLAVPHRIAEDKGNTTYILHTYNPAENRFLELRPGGKPLLLDNLELDSTQRLLLTLTRSGRYGQGNIYKFERGLPWLYRTRKGEFIGGFASEWDVIYEVSEFDRSGKLVRRELSEFPSAFKAVLRSILRETVLFSSPNSCFEIGKLPKGTQAKIVELSQIGDAQWIRVEAGSMKGWIKP